MAKKSAIEIRVVKNGYIVGLVTSYENRGSYTPNEEINVFESFKSLVQWLGENLVVPQGEHWSDK